MHIRKLSSVLCIALFLGAVTSLASGQAVTATLVGTISDKSGATIGDARVTITEQQTGAKLTQSSNASGNYEFTFLPPGIYSVSVESAGFEVNVTRDVQVPVNTTARVDVILVPGSTSQTVTVTDQAAMLQTDRADVSAQLDAKQVKELPLGAKRNFQALEALVPGVSTPVYDHSTFFDAQGSASFTVNGQSNLSNNLLFEGIDDNERSGELQVYIPPAAAIQTVDVETSNYAPEFGRSAGAVTNVILKSGTNNFHGSLYEFNSISATSARSYFNNTGAFPGFTNNYYGGTIGGPIRRNHTFFFADYLAFSNDARQYLLLTVPTAAFRTGDLSASPTPIYDPQTGNPDGTGRKQFVTNGVPNVIPQDRLSAIPQKILALVPEPNIPGAGTTNNYQETLGLRVNSKQFDVKIDHTLLTNDHFTYRYSYQHVTTVQDPAFGLAGGPGGSSGFQGTGIDTTYNTAGQYTHVFSPTLITEGRLGVSHYVNTARPSDYGSNTSAQLGIPGVNTDEFSSGLVGITVNGFSAPLVGYDIGMPWNRSETNINAANNWTKIWGNHSVKFGAELWDNRDDLTQGQIFGPRGTFTYSDGQTALNMTGSSTSFGNDFASFLLDLPSQVGRDTNIGDGSYREISYFAFIQDGWQASPKLTLTYGLRYEIYPPLTPNRRGGFSQYDPATNSLQVSGYGNIPNNLGLQFNNKNFEPRLGFAYRANGGNILRGGFGISHSQWQDDTYAYNYPVRGNFAYNSLGTYTPAINDVNQPETLAQGFPPATLPSIPDSGIIPNASINSDYIVINKKYKDPYVMSYNLTVERDIGHQWIGSIAYVGNQGRQIPSAYNLNAGFVAGAGANGQPEFATFGRTAATNLRAKGTNSNYNSLQARLTHRYSNGLEWTSAYAWQKGMGFINSAGGLDSFQFYLDTRRDYAPVTFVHPQTYAQSFLYELPFGRNKQLLNGGAGAWIAGGWQVGSILSIQSGTPLQLTASTSQLNAPGNTQVPDQIKSFKKLKGIGTQSEWFDPTAFVQPQGAVLGNVAKSAFSGPGAVTFDASATRTFPIYEALTFQFRMDAYNALNHPTFNNPDTSLTDASFGHVTGITGSARTLQFSGTLNF